MAKRYYISPVVPAQDGVPHGGAHPLIQEVIEQLGLAPSEGQYIEQIMPLEGELDWCLCIVNVINHAALLQDGRFDTLADMGLDGKVTAIGGAVVTRIRNALTKRGIDAQSIFQNADTYRDVIREIGKKLQKDFTPNNFDIGG